MSELKNPKIVLDNMLIYESVRSVPEEAKKIIGGGRLKGMTDINPMWRIKMLTEMFGPCGFGWRVDNVTYWTQPCDQTHELAVFCQLELSYFDGTNWSCPMYGIGGSMLIAKESGGVRLDDEAYKKAYTDAISVACKALGIGADVYWSADRTKYTGPSAEEPKEDKCEVCGRKVEGRTVTAKGVTAVYKPEDIIKKTRELYGKCMCYDCMAATKAAKKAAG